MNNSLYHWHEEVMVSLERQDLQREIESIRLLHDAGLANPGLFERVSITLGKILVKWGKSLNELYTAPHQAYQVTSGKYAA